MFLMHSQCTWNSQSQTEFHVIVHTIQYNLLLSITECSFPIHGLNLNENVIIHYQIGMRMHKNTCTTAVTIIIC